MQPFQRRQVDRGVGCLRAFLRSARAGRTALRLVLGREVAIDVQAIDLDVETVGSGRIAFESEFRADVRVVQLGLKISSHARLAKFGLHRSAERDRQRLARHIRPA